MALAKSLFWQISEWLKDIEEIRRNRRGYRRYVEFEHFGLETFHLLFLPPREKAEHLLAQ